MNKNIDDFFIRCKLAKYQPEALSSLCADGENFIPFIKQSLTTSNEFLASLPIATAGEEKALPLKFGINPVWSTQMTDFIQNTIIPLLGDLDELSEDNWNTLKEKLSSYSSWQNLVQVELFPQLVLSI